MDASDVASIDIQIANDHVVIDDPAKIEQYVHALRKIITYGEKNAAALTGFPRKSQQKK